MTTPMTKPTLTVACFLLKSAWQAVCRPFSDQLRRLSPLRYGSLRSALTTLLLAPLAALHAADAPKPPPAELPASIRPSAEWTAQAAKDAARDFTSIPFDGKSPDKLACDTTLRELPDGSWVMVMLGGDAVALLHNPNPKGRHPLALWISFDGMKTWPYQRVLVEHSSDGPGRALNYPDGFVSKDKQWLHFAYDDARHRAVHYSAKLPPLP